MLPYKEPSPEQIKSDALYRTLGLTDQEYETVIELIGRLPNYTETGLFSAMWSEHCSYKNSKPVLKKFPTKGAQVLQGPGEGAGIVDIGDGLAVTFKVESHNSPSAVEPYEGAATGVGGIVRDVFSMGARPIACLNSLRFGELNTPRARYLFENAVAGIADYGNILGVPTVGGEVYFESSYEANPLVNAMCVGIIKHEDIQRGIASGVGNSVLYVGNTTGRDGIHGAAFSSEKLGDDSKQKITQAGDPFVEKQLMEACLEMMRNPALKGIQDMGAAGIVSSSSEMAGKAGNGLELNLELVPQRAADMSAFEIMLSESQERMLLVVERGSEDEFLAICDKWGLAGAVIGKVTDDQRYRLFHKGELVCDVPVDSLADSPVYYKPSQEPASFKQNQDMPITDLLVGDVTKTFKKLLAMPTIASKEWAYRQFDYSAQTDTVLAPGSDAAVVRIKGTNKAVAMTVDCNSRYLALDPKTGAAIAVAEAARNVVCSGAKPLALTDCLNFGSPENPEVFWQFEQAADGIAAASKTLNTPVVSGNVSLYNESKQSAIYPTPVIGLVGLIDDLEHITTQKFTNSGDAIVLLGKTQAELGGSQLQKLLTNELVGRVPQLNLAYEKKLQDLTLAAIQAGLINSAHDLSEGGLAVGLVESVFGTDLGFEITLESDLAVSALLFGESQSRIVVSVSQDKLEQLMQLAQNHQMDVTVIGTVIPNDLAVISVNDEQKVNTTRSELEKIWREAIACLMTV